MKHHDVKYCIRNSEEPVFITGDQSLVEAISFNKLFFYQMHYWKVSLFNSFFYLARYLFPPEQKSRKRKRESFVRYYDGPKHQPYTEYVRLITGYGTPKNFISDRRVKEEARLIGTLLREKMDEIQRQKEVVYKTMRRYYDIERSLDCAIKRSVHKNERTHRELKEMLVKLLQDQPNFQELERRYVYLVIKARRGVVKTR
jgi:hypothetical protein